MKLDVIDAENKKTTELEIDDKLLDVKVKDDLIHDVLLALQQNRHTGSSNTLTRAEVRGGGKKPWKQKGTGQARHGSTRSPIWKGGGVTFGPRPLKSRIKMNRDSKKRALQAVLAGKIKKNGMVIIDEFKVPEPKTKEVVSSLKKLNLAGVKLLFITDKNEAPLLKASRNIRGFTTVNAKDVNVYDLLVHANILATKKAVEEMIRRIG
ncbi:MAG TPA: 50S ribosomal protein L4 [bacterium]|nr:50S ribosomal protein L4 [bacterium]